MSKKMQFVPDAAPHDSCVACFRGDVPTGVALYGPPTFHADALVAWGISIREAASIVAHIGAIGDDPADWGKTVLNVTTVPADVECDNSEVQIYRLCAGCASKANMTAESISNIEHVHCHDQTVRPLKIARGR